MKILVDAKNLALYGGGIAHWALNLFRPWVELRKNNYEFYFICPTATNLRKVDIDVGLQFAIQWPTFMPRKLRHPWYDNWQFSRAIKKINPQFIFSPYHDVRLPRKRTSLYSVITVHDLCFVDVPESYPFIIRKYYDLMMRLNISRAHHVITVSEATKWRLIERFGLSSEVVSVIPNAIDPQFSSSSPNAEEIAGWRIQYVGKDHKLALYSGGIEYRKNVKRLLEAFRILWQRGCKVTLCITGDLDDRWSYLFLEEELNSGKVQFLGFLSLTHLRLAYQAVDCIVYPSLCEGFGRVCLEAMSCGTPLACSDLTVFHEVAGDYPLYFNPLNIDAMATAIAAGLERGPQTPQKDCRFELAKVQSQFIDLMDQLIGEAKILAERS